MLVTKMIRAGFVIACLLILGGCTESTSPETDAGPVDPVRIADVAKSAFAEYDIRLSRDENVVTGVGYSNAVQVESLSADAYEERGEVQCRVLSESDNSLDLDGPDTDAYREIAVGDRRLYCSVLVVNTEAKPTLAIRQFDEAMDDITRRLDGKTLSPD